MGTPAYPEVTHQSLGRKGYKQIDFAENYQMMAGRDAVERANDFERIEGKHFHTRFPRMIRVAGTIP